MLNRRKCVFTDLFGTMRGRYFVQVVRYRRPHESRRRCRLLPVPDVLQIPPETLMFNHIITIHTDHQKKKKNATFTTTKITAFSTVIIKRSNGI